MPSTWLRITVVSFQVANIQYLTGIKVEQKREREREREWGCDEERGG